MRVHVSRLKEENVWQPVNRFPPSSLVINCRFVQRSDTEHRPFHNRQHNARDVATILLHHVRWPRRRHCGRYHRVGGYPGSFVAPVWGYISDRLYRTKLGRKIGRRRGTILLTIPGLFIFMLVQFYPGMPTWGYAVANFLYWTCNAGVTTIQYVLPSEMTSNSNQRSQLVGLNQITTAVSTITLSMLNTYLFSIWGDNVWTSYFKMALGYANRLRSAHDLTSAPSKTVLMTRPRTSLRRTPIPIRTKGPVSQARLTRCLELHFHILCFASFDSTW